MIKNISGDWVVCSRCSNPIESVDNFYHIYDKEHKVKLQEMKKWFNGAVLCQDCYDDIVIRYKKNPEFLSRVGLKERRWIKKQLIILDEYFNLPAMPVHPWEL